ncbi:CRISPR-associated endonuclease Cas3'' [Caldinitratiruptor microaerophilus]|uniref:CRISPR-associated helicase/endonuclease Cas3 n=1 Tax=Caldinitratiruptor microaerophilus TaxID=671077 RepID=A0AA35G8I5_9FIRM|nr:CRISPR-associated endonuclease Cas3'' [Caldinitratiruptor microaerophilus]BDG59299.1 CRISPR-associated helicase/endonuclease Cas3 [Caldinitratiruptor microaerophilus]
MTWLAHSAFEGNEGHDLKEHLYSVAALTRQFATALGAPEWGWWAGLWHDIGKIHPLFQAYLKDSKVARGPDHKGAGTVMAFRHAQPLAFVIAGHHGGLHSLGDLKSHIHEWMRSSHVQEALAQAKSHFSDLEPHAPLPTPQHLRGPLEQEFFIRLLFSSLVDADRLDTEAYFHPDLANLRVAPVRMDELWRLFEANQRNITGKPGVVGQVRHEAYLACLRAALESPGWFRLTVPTGGGKTRSTLAFGLRHALLHGLDRVIVAIPYTSIVEQTVDVYRDILGVGAVLEHHSSMEGPADPLNPTPAERWAELAAENWDAPVIVTTTVQLFESLFTNHPSKARKLHNLVRSVIILDEAQSLPPGLLEPILDGLRQLTVHYGATVVLATATQPALDDSPVLHGLPGIREIAPEHPRWYQELRRVDFSVVPPDESWPWERVAEEMRSRPQVLTIVNTRADAARLLEALGDPEVLHLSSMLCGAHRRAVLAEVKRRLTKGLPCRLVTTQVVEAGVDLDFPVVFRAVGPLDRIVQAAGRCNREGRLTRGLMTVFTPAEGGLPRGAYSTATHIAQKFMAFPDFDFYDPGLFLDYFREVYRHTDTDANRVQKLRASFDFPAVAREFRMIPSDTLPLVVPYWEVAPGDVQARQAASRISELRRGERMPPRSVWRQLQPYIVQVDRRQLGAYPRGLAIEIVPGLWEWRGRYDRVRGLVNEPLAPEDVVV